MEAECACGLFSLNAETLPFQDVLWDGRKDVSYEAGNIERVRERDIRRSRAGNCYRCIGEIKAEFLCGVSIEEDEFLVKLDASSLKL